MKQIVLLALLTITAFLAVVSTVHANEHIAGNSAQLTALSVEESEDVRVVQLRSYLEKHNSPLALYAEEFVHQADENHFSGKWSLVAAIAGVESTFGKHVPVNSYNAWGWGIPTGAQSGIGFKKWEDGIATVSRGLKNNYMDKGAITLAQIGRIYAPPSNTWSGKVDFFMNQIESHPVEPQLTI